MKQSIEINWEALGAEFAELSDEKQAEFFRGLAYELRCYPSRYLQEVQMFGVAARLPEKDKDTLEVLGCLWFKESD